MDNKIANVAFGLFGGLAAAVACLVILPLAFSKNTTLTGIFGIITGGVLAGYIDGGVRKLSPVLQICMLTVCSAFGILLTNSATSLSAFFASALGGCIIYISCGYAVLEKDSGGSLNEKLLVSAGACIGFGIIAVFCAFWL